MGRERKKKYIDVKLSDKDLVKVRKGYTVVKKVKENWVAVHNKGKDRAVQRKIDKLKSRIKELEGKKK